MLWLTDRERDVMFINRAIEQCDLRSDEAWHYARVGWRRLLRDLTDAEARIAELEADAARYRWLRDKSPGQWTLQVGDLPLFKGDVDAAIDAAMAKGESREQR